MSVIKSLNSSEEMSVLARGMSIQKMLRKRILLQPLVELRNFDMNQ